MPERNFHGLSFISKRSFICCGSFINFIVVAIAVAVPYYTCYNLGKNPTSNKILVTYTLVLTNFNKY